MQSAIGRYSEPRYRYKYTGRKRAREMTYILGSRCSDGVVVVADRKFTVDYGSSYLYDTKLVHEMGGIVVCFSGNRGVFELFQTEIRNHVMKESGGSIEHDPFVLKTSEIIERLNKRFYGSENKFDALIALGNQPSSLKYFYSDGRMETVTTCKAIGAATPYGSVFLNRFWSSSMNMYQVAELGYFIIKYIETAELDLSVGVAEGGHPQIWFLPDGFDSDGSVRSYEPDQARLERFETNTMTRLQRYNKALYDAYKLDK
jgi:20S proteasome alpha/beta subunit